MDVRERHSGLAVALTPSEAAAVWALPLFTVSNSEGGVERNFQGTMLHLRWALELAPGTRWEQTTRTAVAGADGASPP